MSATSTPGLKLTAASIWKYCAVVAAGAEIIVAGSAIFGAADPEAAVRGLREATVQWV